MTATTRDNQADYAVHKTRAAANQCARFFLRRGHWVEIYDDATKELLAGRSTRTRSPPNSSSETAKSMKTVEVDICVLTNHDTFTLGRGRNYSAAVEDARGDRPARRVVVCGLRPCAQIGRAHV